MKNKFVLVTLCLIYLFSPSYVFCSDTDYSLKKDIDEAWKNDKVCNYTFGDYYMPRKLLKQIMDDNYNFSLGFENLATVTFMYSDEIDYLINKPINSGYDFLECAYRLNKSEEKLLNKFVGDILMTGVNVQDASRLDAIIRGAESIKKNTSTMICRQYNKIANSFEKNKNFDKAEEIYRYVVGKFSTVEGCLRVAEISLVTLNNKRNFYNYLQNKSTIAEGEGSACVGKEQSRKQTEQAALLEAKRKAVESVSTQIKSETQLYNFEISKDIVSAYANAEVKILQELSKAWYKDSTYGHCYRVKIRAEVIPNLHQP
jgi:hypothetical protein